MAEPHSRRPRHDYNHDGEVMKLVRNHGCVSSMTGALVPFVWSNKRWWLVPMIVTLCLLGALIVLSRVSTLAPYIYTLF